MTSSDSLTSRALRWSRGVVPDGLLRASSWGVLDQAIISGTNFATVIVAARLLGPASFGVFSLVFTTLVFAETVQRSLITTPHNVLGVSREGKEYQAYTSSAAVLQLALALLILILGLIGSSFAGLVSDGLAVTVMIAAFAASCWQCQEFTRRVLYTEFRIPAAVFVDSATYLSRWPVIGLLALGPGLTTHRLLLAFAGTWLFGSLLGTWKIRGSLCRSFNRSVLWEHWAFGRWLFASNGVSYLPRYVAAALLSSVLSVAAYGGYRAFEQLANGANVPLTALSNVLRPRLAREAKRGPYAVWQTMLPVMVLGGAALAVFAVLLIALREPLANTIYGTEYSQYSVALFLVAFLPFVTFQKSMLIKALQAFRNTRPIFLGTASGAIFGSTLGALCVVLFGLPAAGAIMMLAGVTSTAWLAWVWRGHFGDEESWQKELKQTREPSAQSRASVN